METKPASRIGTELLGKYRLDELLGAGGMAEVYRARNLLAGRDVAIKLLHPEMLDRPTIVQRFLREARAANTVRHPNIVDVLDVDKDEGGIPFIVQEYLEGVDLKKKIASWSLSAEEVLELFIPVAEAVGLAHEGGIVHRDLKPDNVFLAVERGEVVPKVLDFGISKLPVEENPELLGQSFGPGDKRLTSAGSSIGTPLYMSPEQIRDPRSVDARTDVWSLGVMLYQALSGEIPFDGEDVYELFAEIERGRPVPLDERAPRAPSALVTVVERCLRPSPDERFADAGELATALREVRARLRQGRADTQPPPKLSLEPADSRPPPPSEPGIGELGDLADTHHGPVDPDGLLSDDDGFDIQTFLEPSGEPEAPAHPTPRTEPGIRRAIEAAIEAALTRRGRGGKVVLRDGTAELHDAAGVVTAVDLGQLAEQWNVLPPDITDKRVAMVARRLDAASAASAAPAGRGFLRLALWATLVVALGAAGLWAYRHGWLDGSRRASVDEGGGAPPPRPSAESSAAAVARERRACEASRRKLYASGDLGATTTGWVVELWLARSGEPITFDLESLASLEQAAGLAEGSVPGVVEATLSSPMGELQTAVVQLRKGHVDRFFQSAGRDAVVDFAQRVVQHTKARHAALYARCAHLTTRDVGAWYAGADRAGALASLVYASGGYADPPAFERGEAEEDGALIRQIEGAARRAPEEVVAAPLREAGGRVDREAGRVAIRFALGGPTRAAQASRKIASALIGSP